MTTKSRLHTEVPDSETLVVKTETDGESLNLLAVEKAIEHIRSQTPERRHEPTVEASEALCKYAADHIHPTIEALTTLEQTIAACKEALKKDLEKLSDQSRGFATRNKEAQHCLSICTDAVTQLINGRDHGPS